MNKIVFLFAIIIDSFLLNAQEYQDMKYYKLGMSLIDSSKYKEAIFFFNKAIKLNPGNTIYFYKRGHAYFNTNNFDSAINDFSHCYKILRDESEYPFLIGLCLEKKNLIKDAFYYYDRAIEIDSTQTKYFKYRANLFLKVDSFTKAIKDYNLVIAKEPNNGNAYYNRGIAKYKLNSKQEACLDWLNALQNSNEKARIYLEKYCKY